MPQRDTNLYRSFDVWKRKPGGVARYRFFELIPKGGFCIQSVDMYWEEDPAKHVASLDSNFIELLCALPPDERSGVHLTIEEAIMAFERGQSS